jgi:PAS domain S-box-containing protein
VRERDSEAFVRLQNALLEQRVAQRTAELEVAISNLHAQNCQRTRAEAALRESEERYRRLVELSPEAVLVVSGERLAYVNAAGLRLFGATDADEMLSIPPLDLVHAEDRTRATAGLRRLITAGTVAPQAETRLRRLDGTIIEAEVTAAGITFGGAPAVQILVRDVSERRAVERIKDELLSIVSHELRTPLTSIRGSLGLLGAGLLGALTPKGQRMLEIAIGNTDRLIRLLNNMLDLERLRAGRLTFELRPCLVADVVEQTVAEMRGLSERAGVQLLVGRAEGTIHAEPDRLVQVLTNLASNAVKFSPRGSQVHLEAVDDGRQVRFCIRDGGRGIPADKLERIFERFEQVDASDARLDAGAGLGLAICHGIVQQHGGRIWAESAVGAGSTFYVELRSAAPAAMAA